MLSSFTTRRGWIAASACASIAVTALFSTSAVSATVVPDDSTWQHQDLTSRFSLGIPSDTQFYSRYATQETGDLFNARYGSEPFETQTSWLADTTDELHMPFVTHLGDVVEQAYVPAEWPVADATRQNLEDGDLPYSILPGNHDLTSDGSVPYRRHLPNVSSS
ncbi:hypothetical protein [Enteractinococcus coprophilus]|uniref:hypothetical protein n=1 Tax=Enteractinococcus coprophilus TaxID=1027633 RepID=UPI00114DC16D|nr:hypothetical protein [Enteractinococcus coprophilus]